MFKRAIGSCRNCPTSRTQRRPGWPRLGPSHGAGSNGDAGFSLLEATIALFIGTTVFLALGTAMVSSLSQMLLSRENQQAVDVLNQRVEQLRSFPYASVVMSSADLASDPAISGSAGSHYYRPGAGASELVAENTVGQIAQHVFPVVENGIVYNVSEYVTRPVDPTIGTTVSGAAADAYKRLTVVASWSHAGRKHTRQVTTLLAPTQRGLPLPRFRFQVTPTTQTIRKASSGDTPTLEYGLSLRNLGARDTWDITASSSGWTFYLDANQNGVRDTGNPDPTLNENQAMPAFGPGAGGGGCQCTGPVEPNTTVFIVAERTISAGETGTVSVTFTMTSQAQPSDPATGASTAASVPVTATITVGSGVVPLAPAAGPTASPSPAPTPACFGGGCKLQAYYLYNGDSTGLKTGDTLSLDPQPMTQSNGSLQAGNFNYSTDLAAAAAGRNLVPTGSVPDSEASPAKVIDFRFGVPARKTYTVGGTATVTFYVRCAASGVASFRAALGASTSTTSLADFSLKASGTASMTTCSTTGFTPLTVAVPISGTFAVGAPNTVTLRIQTTGSSVPVQVMYGSAGYPAELDLPQK